MNAKHATGPHTAVMEQHAFPFPTAQKELKGRQRRSAHHAHQEMNQSQEAVFHAVESHTVPKALNVKKYPTVWLDRKDRASHHAQSVVMDTE